jgi:hypothetical protein
LTVWRPSRRQLLLSGGAAAASAGLIGAPRAQQALPADVRIGTVFPASTGLSTVRTSINDYPGNGARGGAILAETVIGESASQLGTTLDVLLASSPSISSAQRAGERLVETEQVHALVGGVEAGRNLNDIANEAGVLSSMPDRSNDFRTAPCSYSFHIEPSAAMYRTRWEVGRR